MVLMSDAQVKGYADDSRYNGRIWAVGGYAGHDAQWEQFERDWPRMLDKHDVPYFHMKEFADPSGVYKKWHPIKEHYGEIAMFFADMVQIISDCWLRGYWSITRVNDLAKFNADKGVKLEAYPLAAYGCMLGIAKDHHRGVTSEIIFDHVEKIHSKLATAFAYAETDNHYSMIKEMVAPTPLNADLTFRQVRPLQAADFLIWEIQKNHRNIEDWFLLPDKPSDQDDREAHMDNWSMEKFGTLRPPARKSLEALMEHAAPPMGIIWDYDNLCQAHELRGGVWSQ
jgi:hypothetical protein